MSRKATIALGLLVLLMLSIITVSALPKIPSYFGLNINNDYAKLPVIPPFPGWSKGKNDLMVIHCSGDFYWSDIDKGDSICTLPSGKISAGDLVTNCQGRVVLTHVPANTVIFTNYFTPNNIQDNPENPGNPDDDPYIPDNPDKLGPEIPDEDPTISITKPAEKTMYLRNLNIKSSDITRVLGYIDIEAEVDNPTDIDIKEVRFYIDGSLRSTDDEAPYSWRWNEKVLGEKTITVVAISDTNEEIASAEIIVSILNLNLK